VCPYEHDEQDQGAQHNDRHKAFGRNFRNLGHSEFLTIGRFSPIVGAVTIAPRSYVQATRIALMAIIGVELDLSRRQFIACPSGIAEMVT